MTHIHTKLHITEADLKVKKLEAYEKTKVEKNACHEKDNVVFQLLSCVLLFATP